jgi:hypothetical protein
VGEIERLLTSVEGVEHIISEYVKDYRHLLIDWPDERVRRALCIDAFSIDPTARWSLIPRTPDGCKNCFLYQLTHLDRFF